ncbi:hypothetical protein RND81_11G104000 [Saponaria officinalis]|uniref:Uncharacterized protein n=1 Tax=Saponaria officinalis TaxID=3572 RepID=A0AAW1HJC8_SAPOF
MKNLQGKRKRLLFWVVCLNAKQVNGNNVDVGIIPEFFNFDVQTKIETLSTKIRTPKAKTLETKIETLETKIRTLKIKNSKNRNPKKSKLTYYQLGTKPLKIKIKIKIKINQTYYSSHMCVLI